MSEIKLEPCKYCGGKGAIHRLEDRVSVECEHRDYAACAMISDGIPADRAEHEAVQRWNDRNLVPSSFRNGGRT